jgi:hypothetical protein
MLVFCSAYSSALKMEAIDIPKRWLTFNGLQIKKEKILNLLKLRK